MQERDSLPKAICTHRNGFRTLTVEGLLKGAQVQRRAIFW